MPEIEVRASRSFSHMGRNFTRGRRYRVDPDSPLEGKWVMGLLAGGYFVEVPDDCMDHAGPEPVPGSGVDPGLPGHPAGEKRPTREVTDGKGETEPGAN